MIKFSSTLQNEFLGFLLWLASKEVSLSAVRVHESCFRSRFEMTNLENTIPFARKKERQIILMFPNADVPRAIEAQNVVQPQDLPPDEEVEYFVKDFVSSSAKVTRKLRKKYARPVLQSMDFTPSNYLELIIIPLFIHQLAPKRCSQTFYMVAIDVTSQTPTN
jgi:hypothetical protein